MSDDRTAPGSLAPTFDHCQVNSNERRGNVTRRQPLGLLPKVCVCVFYFVSYVAPLMTRGTNIDYRWNSFIVVCFRLLYDYTVPLTDCWTLTHLNAFLFYP